MKPTLVADEMFPEGAGPYVELEEVMNYYAIAWKRLEIVNNKLLQHETCTLQVS